MAGRRQRKFRVWGSPICQRTRARISAAARRAQRFALPVCAGYTVAVAVFVRIVHRAGATAEYNNGSDELLHGTTIIRGPGKVHGGAGGGGSGGRNEGAAVGDSPPFVPVSQSRLHRRCAHRGARGRERRRLLFRPGALFTPEGPESVGQFCTLVTTSLGVEVESVLFAVFAPGRHTALWSSYYAFVVVLFKRGVKKRPKSLCTRALRAGLHN